MSAPAAIRATFADFRTVRSRKVAQLILEIPIEAATAALNALGGVPNPAEEVWVAVARLQPGKEVVPAEPNDDTPANSLQPDVRAAGGERPKRRWDELPASQQAALTCADPAFLEYCETKDEAVATARLKRCLAIESRRELDSDPKAQLRWQQLYERFNTWLRFERGRGAA